jgi:hypothetical protein
MLKLMSLLRTRNCVLLCDTLKSGSKQVQVYTVQIKRGLQKAFNARMTEKKTPPVVLKK